jgi:hypothetical protein
MKRHHRFLLIGVVALVLVATIAFTGRHQSGPEATLALQPPPFVHAAGVESPAADAEISAQLEDEAGISAYIQTSGPIDLSLVRDEFRTIESETAEYIIGSVSVPSYPEHFDVHVYIHTDGWILAYYLEDEATSKIVDVKAQSINSTKLESVVAIIAGTLGEAITDIKYYDFRYPNATNILMVAENSYNGNQFMIELPPDYGYSERSWAAYEEYDDTPDFEIDGHQAPRDWSGWDMGYGSISSSQLAVGEQHTVRVANYDGYGSLVITYRVP